MAAALGLDLVFDVAAGGSGLDEGADGAGEVEGSAEAGVDVDEQGEGADVGDAANVGEDVVDGGDAEVGHAERACGYATAGEVEGAVADAFGHACVVGVDGADDLERVFGGDGGAECLTGSHRLEISRCRRCQRAMLAVWLQGWQRCGAVSGGVLRLLVHWGRRRCGRLRGWRG